LKQKKLENIDLKHLESYAKEMLDIVSKNVIKYRKDRGLSQKQLAIAIGFKSAAYLGKSELRTNNQHFNISQIAKISKVLNVEINSFFK